MAGIPGLVMAPMAAAHALQLRPAMASMAHQQQQQQQQQLRAAAEARKLAARKRKAADKAAGDKVVTLIPESALFNSLAMQERQLDHAIKRRRGEIQQAANPYDHPVQKRLRIYIYATHTNQPAAAAAAAGGAAAAGQHASARSSSQGGASASAACRGSGVRYAEPAASQHGQEPPAWSLMLWGRLVDINDPPPEPGSAAAAAVAAVLQQQQQAQHAGQPQHKFYQPFTSFFKRITIQADPQQYPGSEGHVVWEKFHHRGAHKDRMEFRRLGSSNVGVDITFEQDSCPPLYQLDPRLSELLGVRVDQQMSALARIWAYVHKQKEQTDPQVLQLDDKLAAVLGVEQLPRMALPEALGKLLKPLEPVTVSHTIDVSGASPGAVTCLDVDVVITPKLAEKGVDSIGIDDKPLEAIEQKLAGQLHKLYEARRRRAFYLGFAEAPVAFINAVIASQARELRAVRTITGKMDVELERRTDVFNEKWVEEAAAKYLAKRNGHTGL